MATAKTKARGGEPRAFFKPDTLTPEVHPTGHYARGPYDVRGAGDVVLAIIGLFLISGVEIDNGGTPGILDQRLGLDTNPPSMVAKAAPLASAPTSVSTAASAPKAAGLAQTKAALPGRSSRRLT